MSKSQSKSLDEQAKHIFKIPKFSNEIIFFQNKNMLEKKKCPLPPHKRMKGHDRS
jgi:hypothetical protein